MRFFSAKGIKLSLLPSAVYTRFFTDVSRLVFVVICDFFFFSLFF